MTQHNYKEVLKLLISAGELKRIKRTGWLTKGVKDAESVADHTWRMSLMVMLLADASLDKNKLYEMNIIHDMGEITVGDLNYGLTCSTKLVS